MDDLPRLETPRLILRVPTPADAGAMTDFVSDNREHLAPWEPLRDDRYFTEEYWKAELERMIQRAHTLTSLTFVLEPRGEAVPAIIGRCTFSGIARGPFQAAYLGYALDRRAVGGGLMEEALRAAVAYCFGELNLHRIMANYMPSNTRSAKLLRRLGFVPEGYARDYLLLAGNWQDHILNSLTNPGWQAT